MTATTVPTALHPQRIAVRFPLAHRIEDLEPAITVFHRCIQRGWLEGQLLDVADYRHVPAGPGVMLVGHDVDYSLWHDTLTVTRKRSADDDAATQVRDLLRAAAVLVEALDYDGTLDVQLGDHPVAVLLLDRALEAQLGAELADAADDLAEAQDTLAEAVAAAFAEAWADDDPTVWGTGRDDPRAPLTALADWGPRQATPAEVIERLGGSRARMQSPFDITVEEFAERRDEDGVVVLDVREESEYGTVNLGGRLLPLAQLPDRLDELDRDATILVHCRAGVRGGKAVQLLRDAGFDDAWNVNGALVAWADRIDPDTPRY